MKIALKTTIMEVFERLEMSLISQNQFGTTVELYLRKQIWKMLTDMKLVVQLIILSSSFGIP